MLKTFSPNFATEQQLKCLKLFLVTGRPCNPSFFFFHPIGFQICVSRCATKKEEKKHHSKLTLATKCSI